MASQLGRRKSHAASFAPRSSPRPVPAPLDGADDACDCSVGTPSTRPLADMGAAALAAASENIGSRVPAGADVEVAAAGTPQTGRHAVRRRTRDVAYFDAVDPTTVAAGAGSSRDAEQLHPEAAIPAEPAAACTPAALNECRVHRFLSTEEGPVASGGGQAASKAVLLRQIIHAEPHPVGAALWAAAGGSRAAETARVARTRRSSGAHGWPELGGDG